jgi:hypothetical protein
MNSKEENSSSSSFIKLLRLLSGFRPRIQPLRILLHKGGRMT